MQSRIFFLDNLRTFIIFLVVLIHAGMSYTFGTENFWIAVDPNISNNLSLINTYLDLFIMFTIFFIAGYFVPASLKNKSDKEFLMTKFKRIFLPWIIAVLTLIPLYKMIFLEVRGLPQEEWYSYFHCFKRAGTDLAFFANNPTQSWLWFLPILFTFQLVYLGLSKLKLLNWNISIKYAVVLVFVLSVAYCMAISSLGLTGWTHMAFFDFQHERLLVYFMMFLLGARCHKLNVFAEGKKNIKLYITANVVFSLSLGIFTAVALNLFFNMIDPQREYYFVSPFFDRLFYYISALASMFSILYVLIHVFRYNFNKQGALIKQLNKNSYTVYIIHMIVLGLVVWAQINLNWPALVKYFLTAFLTFAISNVLISSYRSLTRQNIILKYATPALMALGFVSIVSLHAGQGEEIEIQPKTQETTLAQPSMGLHEAVIHGDLQVVREHIDLGTNLDQKEPAGGSSALLVASLLGKTDIALALIEAGADINLINNEGSTALITAAFFGRVGIVEALLNKGANKDIKNNTGSTALTSVLSPYESVAGIYDYFEQVYKPIGLELDRDELKKNRGTIADMLAE